MSALGIMFRREYPPEHLPDFTRQAEAAGFDELWVVEDCFYAGGIAQAAVALAHSSRMQVGLGIMPAVARNAAFTALEIASLARIAPGRFLPGLGHGVADWMRQIGALPASQLGALEAVTAAIHALLRGENVTTHGGGVDLDHVQLEFPLDDPPPLQLGVRGPRSLQLAGRVADGVILAEGCSPPYVRWAQQQVAAGRAQANRSDGWRTTLYIYWAMDADPAAAKARVRDHLAPMMAGGWIDVYLEPLGIREAVAALAAEGGVERLRAQMPDSWLHQMAVVGDATQCAATLQQLEEAGADSVVLVPMMDNAAALHTYAPALLAALG